MHSTYSQPTMQIIHPAVARHCRCVILLCCTARSTSIWPPTQRHHGPSVRPFVRVRSSFTIHTHTYQTPSDLCFRTDRVGAATHSSNYFHKFLQIMCELATEHGQRLECYRTLNMCADVPTATTTTTIATADRNDVHACKAHTVHSLSNALQPIDAY